MLEREDLTRLEAIEEAATGVLTLTEGLEREELGRSRLTREAVRRQLLTATQAVGSLSHEARDALPELDCDAWRSTGERLAAGDAVESERGWFAIHALAPATLGWLRFYRARQPELFAATPPENQ